MPVFRRVDVIDSTSEGLAEARGESNGAMMTLGIVVLVVAVCLIGYFAWYAPNQAAAQQPQVIEHTTSTTTNNTTTPVPANNPPIIVHDQSAPIVVPSPYPVPAPASPSPSPSSTDGNTSGNTTGAGSTDDGKSPNGGSGGN